MPPRRAKAAADAARREAEETVVTKAAKAEFASKPIEQEQARKLLRLLMRDSVPFAVLPVPKGPKVVVVVPVADTDRLGYLIQQSREP